MTHREVKAAKARIRTLLEERDEKQKFVRQAPDAGFREFAEQRVAVVDRDIEEIRTRLKREGWAC